MGLETLAIASDDKTIRKEAVGLFGRENDKGLWSDWKWQQRNAVRSVGQLLRVFPGLPAGTLDRIDRNLAGRRMQLTPYSLTLVKRTAAGDAPAANDPIWHQLVPAWSPGEDDVCGYDGETENWELPHEMVTPIAQHKYPNRVIIRLSNVCHAYCQFCYEALRTLEKDSSKANFDASHWRATLDYTRDNDGVEEIILSGGEPLHHSDAHLDAVLADLRGVGREIAVRIHTRALTFNPFRITADLTESFRRHRLNSIGLHVSHPNEITDDFVAAVAKLRESVPILFANIPLLNGVNADIETMYKLCMRLYMVGVIPHYLYHFMPHSPGSAAYRTSVQTGVDIVRYLKRRITNLAVPEFVLPHKSGKHTMPLLAHGENLPQWTVGAQGLQVVRYTNWEGETVEYPDPV
jgi:lysine 2,3-aminomutase